MESATQGETRAATHVEWSRLPKARHAQRHTSNGVGYPRRDTRSDTHRMESTTQGETRAATHIEWSRLPKARHAQRHTSNGVGYPRRDTRKPSRSWREYHYRHPSDKTRLKGGGTLRSNDINETVSHITSFGNANKNSISEERKGTAKITSNQKLPALRIFCAPRKPIYFHNGSIPSFCFREKAN